MSSKRSRVHPTYKTKHRVATRTEYDPARETEARLSCNLLNQMLEMARPRSAVIVAENGSAAWEGLAIDGFVCQHP